jgi:hypothetical protein
LKRREEVLKLSIAYPEGQSQRKRQTVTKNQVLLPLREAESLPMIVQVFNNQLGSTNCLNHMKRKRRSSKGDFTQANSQRGEERFCK